MSSALKKFTIIVFSLAITLFTFTSCSEDIVLPPLDTLLGEYNGHYTLTDLSQGGAGVVKADLAINWIFRDFTYELNDSTATICSPSGEYVLSGDQINLEEVFDGNVGGICDRELNPAGDFSLRRPDDSLILTQSLNNILVEVRLKKN